MPHTLAYGHRSINERRPAQGDALSPVERWHHRRQDILPDCEGQRRPLVLHHKRFAYETVRLLIALPE